jgi:hypothetical protein
VTEQQLDEDIATSERLHVLMRRIIALRSDVYTELFDPRWKETQREVARRGIEAAESALTDALRHLNAAAEAERELSSRIRTARHHD